MISEKYTLVFCLLLITQGCATPSENFFSAARQLQFSEQLVKGSPYLHEMFMNSQANGLATIKELHIYLDGDGTPWITDNSIAEDPTPRNPLILEMMAKDPAASLLVGRPCYYGLYSSPLCTESLWTSHRYAKEVIDSMTAAIQQWMAGKNIEKLVFIGYSGGGVLAAFLASRLKNTTAIITIAANLDIEAWSRRHGYHAPEDSLNPAKEAHIPANIRQIHLAGLKDDNVPAEIIEAFSRTQTNSVYLPIPEYDHVCCWLTIWPEILKTQLEIKM